MPFLCKVVVIDVVIAVAVYILVSSLSLALALALALTSCYLSPLTPHHLPLTHSLLAPTLR